MYKLSLCHRAVVAALCLVLGACGSFEKLNERGKVNYKSTPQNKPLDIPPDLTGVSPDDRFIVPDVGSKGVVTASGLASVQGHAVAQAGQPLVLQADVDVRLEKQGNQRWLVVNRPAEDVWSVVREFWLQSGFQLKVDKPEIGILETDWLENRAKIPLDGVRRIVGKVFDGLYSSDELDRYRTRLERVSGGTEIYISHRGLQEVYVDRQQIQTVWQARPTDPELEAEFLTRLQVKISGQNAAQAAEKAEKLAKSGKSTDARALLSSVQLIKDPQDLRLQILETFDRSWRRVGLALDRSGFAVEDRDRSKGLYYVQYMPEEQSKDGKQTSSGFFSKWFGGDKPAVVQPKGRYRIVLQTLNGQTFVRAQMADGGLMAPDITEKILTILENELR
jgi:outer membrane protein assembly factor BamC